MSTISVWQHKIQSGWDTGADFLNKRTGLPVPRFPLYEARDAIGRVYNTDAHFVPYRIPGLSVGDEQPRINEAARRSVLTPAGLDPVLDLAVIDVDATKDIKSEGTVEAWSLEQIERVLGSPVGSGCAWYVTRGGFRLLWEVDALAIAPYLETLGNLRAYLATLGIEADRLVDWNRCYRLPFVVRDGEPQVHPSDLDRLGPLPSIPAVQASPFEGIDKAKTRLSLVVPDELVEGEDPGRKRTLFRLASKLRNAGADESELIAALTTLNRSRCKPPLDVFDIEAIARSAMRYDPSPKEVERQEKPVVMVAPGNLPELVRHCGEMLASRDLYQRGGALVTVDRDLDASRGSGSTPGSPVIREVKLSRLRVMLADAGDWRRRKKEGEEVVEIPVDPPKDVVESVRDAGSWPSIRPLIGVTETPTLRADGSILDAPGYDTATGIVFSPPHGLVFPRVTTTGRDDVRRALYALNEVLSDFPFALDHHRSVALAAMLTAVGRFGIEGPTPLFLFDSHTAGSGKGLLANVVSVLCTGRSASVLSLRDDTENEKRITAHLLSGKRVVLLDNVTGSMGGPSLDAALTADIWAGRVLGQSTLVEVPNRATWIATGNNVAIRGDLSRRTLRCYLDVDIERPEERRGFSHPNLVAYVRAHRGRLVAACLTILRAYVEAGRPSLGLAPMGSFGPWSRSVRSALVWAGMPDPVETQKEIREGADRDLDAWSTVLVSWHHIHGSLHVSVPDVVDDLGKTSFGSVDDTETEEHRKALKEALVELAGGRTGELNPRRVGWILSKFQSRIVSKLRLLRGERSNAGRRWFVENLEQGKETDFKEKDFFE